MPERRPYIRVRHNPTGTRPSSPEDLEWAKTPRLPWPQPDKNAPEWDADSAVNDFKAKHKEGFFE